MDSPQFVTTNLKTFHSTRQFSPDSESERALALPHRQEGARWGSAFWAPGPCTEAALPHWARPPARGEGQHRGQGHRPRPARGNCLRKGVGFKFPHNTERPGFLPCLEERVKN